MAFITISKTEIVLLKEAIKNPYSRISAVSMW